MAPDGVDDEKPECDCGCAYEAGDHAFTKKIVRLLSHGSSDPVRFHRLRKKYATSGYIPSEPARTRALARID
jgi:hypothetical protein